eukprot:1186062-Prorocentrum_minimum.AAC.5
MANEHGEGSSARTLARHSPLVELVLLLRVRLYRGHARGALEPAHLANERAGRPSGDLREGWGENVPRILIRGCGFGCAESRRYTPYAARGPKTTHAGICVRSQRLHLPMW